MDLGLGNLAELKGQLLAASLRADTNYDAVITGIGTGVAAAMERFCNRKFGYAAGEVDYCSADRRHWYLKRYPAYALLECAKKDSEGDGWVEFAPPPDGSSLVQQMRLETGYLMFVAIQGYYWSQLRFTYNGGYWYDTTEDGSGVRPAGAQALPGDVKLAWYWQCQHAWKRWDKLGAQIAEDPEKTGAVASYKLTDGVKEMLRRHRRFQIT